MSVRLSYIWLAECESIGPQTAAQLLQGFGSPEAVYAADRSALIAAGLNKRQVDALCDKDLSAAESIAESCAKKGIAILTIGDSAYPDRLRAIADPPLVLYVRGKWPDLDLTPGVAVVGTRKATPYGTETADALGRALAKAGFIEVGGMALGIDGAAHRGALHAGGQTVAVLAGGVDICYPPQNRALMGDILLSGAIISEKPPGSEPKGTYYQARNRIISGLSVAAVIVEAPDYRSGALITARHALDQGRDVYAVPGALGAAQSAACNELIEKGEAALLTGPDALVRAYGALLPRKPDERRVREAFLRQTGGTPAAAAARAWDEIGKRGRAAAQKKQPAPARPSAKTAAPAQPPAGLDGDEKRIADLILQGAGTPEELLEKCDLPPARVMSLVTMLELDGVIRREKGRLLPGWI